MHQNWSSTLVSYYLYRGVSGKSISERDRQALCPSMHKLKHLLFPHHHLFFSFNIKYYIQLYIISQGTRQNFSPLLTVTYIILQCA